MKKFLLGLVAILGMAVCFTACDDEKKDDNASAKDSGTSFYENYKAYSAEDATTSDKTLAAISMLATYKDYENNKENSSWAGDFAKGAASAYAKDKTGIDENATATDLLNVLSDSSLVSEETTDKIEAVSTLATALHTVFK